MRPLKDNAGKDYEIVHSVDLSDEKLKDVAETLGIPESKRDQLKNRKVHIVRDK